MKYHLITAALLMAAGVMHVVGFGSGVFIALAAAVALEIAFWIRLVCGKPAVHAKPLR